MPTQSGGGNPGPGEPTSPSNTPSHDDCGTDQPTPHQTDQPTPSMDEGCGGDDVVGCNRRAVLNCEPKDTSKGVLCLYDAGQSDDHKRKLEILKEIDSRLTSGRTFQALTMVESHNLKSWVKKKMKYHLDEIAGEN